MPVRTLAVIAGVVLVLVLARMSLFTVRQSESVLVLQFGQSQRVVTDPGLHLKSPLESLLVFDRRIAYYDAEVQEIPTQDQKQVRVDAFARYRIDDPLKFYQSARTEAAWRSRLASFLNDALRTEIGRSTMARVLTEERSKIMEKIGSELNSRTRPSFGVEIIDVRIKRVDLPEENSRAVFGRMKSQRVQEADRVRAEGTRDGTVVRAEADKKVVVLLAEARQKAQILRGEGEAQAEQIYRQAYGRDPAFFNFLRSVQALRASLAGPSTSYIGPPNIDLFQLFATGDGLGRLPKPGTPR